MPSKPIEIPPESLRERVFITGIYGSGKTHFAKRFAAQRGVPFLSFDDQFNYALRENQSRAILERLPPAFVMDAIPIDENATWADFRAYEASHEVLIVCAYCPDAVQWVKRLAAKEAARIDVIVWSINRALPGKLLKWARIRLRPLKRWWRGPAPLALTLNDKRERAHLRQYRDFYTLRLEDLRSFRRVLFYDSLREEFTTEDEMKRRLRVETFALHDHLDAASAQYDAMYQDIEVLGAVGYSESYKTWENLRELVPWHGQRVTDLGCFHGYFTFKIEDCGGIARGLDRSPPALETARRINTLRGGRVEFAQWTGGEPIAESDVILCLNVLHHFGDAAAQEAAVAGMRCRTAVFEINAEQRPMIERQFATVTQHPSHRQQRIILRASGKR